MLVCALRPSRVEHRPDFQKLGINIFLSLNFLNDSVVALSRRDPSIRKKALNYSSISWETSCHEKPTVARRKVTDIESCNHLVLLT